MLWSLIDEKGKGKIAVPAFDEAVIVAKVYIFECIWLNFCLAQTLFALNIPFSCLMDKVGFFKVSVGGDFLGFFGIF